MLPYSNMFEQEYIYINKLHKIKSLFTQPDNHTNKQDLPLDTLNNQNQLSV